MVELVIIGFVAGIVCGISPCILPVLPVILVAGATTNVVATDSLGRRLRNTPTGCARPGFRQITLPSRSRTAQVRSGGTVGNPTVASARWRSQARPVSVVAGLVVRQLQRPDPGRFGDHFRSRHLPQEFLRDAGISLLVVVGVSFLFPALSTVLERPFARVRRTATEWRSRRVRGRAGARAWSSCRAPDRSSAPSPWPEPNTRSAGPPCSSPSRSGSGWPFRCWSWLSPALSSPNGPGPCAATPPGSVKSSGVMSSSWRSPSGSTRSPDSKRTFLAIPLWARPGARSASNWRVVEGEGRAPKPGVADLCEVQLHRHRASSIVAWPRTSPASPRGSTRPAASR